MRSMFIPYSGVWSLILGGYPDSLCQAFLQTSKNQLNLQKKILSKYNKLSTFTATEIPLYL